MLKPMYFPMISFQYESKYRKIPIISPADVFVQKAFLVGVFSGSRPIFAWEYYRREFCASKWV